MSLKAAVLTGTPYFLLLEVVIVLGVKVILDGITHVRNSFTLPFN